MTDNVNHPSHYKVGGIETIDFIEAKGLNYNLGNVVKYVTRAGHKNDRLEDLRKAAWYLAREIDGAQPKHPLIVEPIPVEPKPIKPVEPVSADYSTERKHRYPYNAMLDINRGKHKKIRTDTKLYHTLTMIRGLLANGPARRHDIGDVLRETDPHIAKHITMLLDYKLLKVVS